MKGGAIGVFDSGIGGLTVLKEVIRVLPLEDTIYLGDTARVPYGTKSSVVVTRYAKENAQFLVEREIKFLVIACNTASALALPSLKEKFSVPMIGVIEPGVKGAIQATKSKRIGVIGTEGTINSGAYQETIHRLEPSIQVFGRPCPLFVPLVEEGWVNNQITKLTAESYLKDLREGNIDTLILGCTHYPVLKKTIEEIMGSEVTLVDSAYETAKEVSTILKEKGLLKSTSKGPLHKFYVTDLPGRFIRVARKFLNEGLMEEVRQAEMAQMGKFS
jgi:glutamate racemase